MTDYLSKFSQLACYATEDVATDKARQSRFLNGLNTGLQVSLIAHTFSDFQELVNKVLILEDKCKELEDNRKHRMAQQGSHQSQQKARMVPQQFNRFPSQNSFRTPAPTSSPRLVAQNFCNPALTNPNPGNNQQNVQRVYYSYRQPGHFSNQCP